jgi:hypothetical protein
MIQVIAPQLSPSEALLTMTAELPGKSIARESCSNRYVSPPLLFACRWRSVAITVWSGLL